MACNANIRVYRYAAGQRFGKHVDESVEDEHGNISQWTVLIYLNGGAAGLSGGDRSSGGSEAEAGVGEETLRGGETVFYKVRGPSTGVRDYLCYSDIIPVELKPTISCSSSTSWVTCWAKRGILVVDVIIEARKIAPSCTAVRVRRVNLKRWAADGPGEETVSTVRYKSTRQHT